MQHEEFEPPEGLRHTIKCFWHNKRATGLPSNFEVQPDGYAEIIFHFGSSISFYCNGGLQPLPSPFMIGLLKQPIVFHAKNSFEIIGIRCFPWTVFDLMGLPAGNDGVRIFEHPIAQLQSTLAKFVETKKTDEALALITQYFLDARTPIANETTLSKAGVAMRDTNGNMPVSEIASAAYTTVRTLERKFKQASGYTIKDVSAIMRFEQARNHLWLNPGANLARLAYALGYTDQSHLSREFKRYSTTTPAAFARKAKQEKKLFSTDF